MAAAVVVAMLVAVMVTTPVARAEVVPCSSGQDVCRNAHSLSITSNGIFCCMEGFSMAHVGGIVNGSVQNTCNCQRSYYESDCLQGATVCENATTVFGDRCCASGESLSVIAQTIVNGLPVDYCKCRKYISYTLVNGVYREMTQEEKDKLDAQMAQMNAQMTQWSTNFNQQMSQWANSFSQQMNQLSQSLHQSLGNLFSRHGRSTRARRSSFLDKLRR